MKMTSEAKRVFRISGNHWIRRGLWFSLVAGGLFALAWIGLSWLSGQAVAQSLTLDLGGSGDSGATNRIVQTLALLTVLSLAPSLLIMVTAFTRIIIVLSFLRTAIGTQQSPPNAVMVSLALFLTAFVMAPTFEKSYNDGIKPLMNNEITELDAFNRAVKPIHAFMSRHVREKDLKLFMDPRQGSGL